VKGIESVRWKQVQGYAQAADSAPLTLVIGCLCRARHLSRDGRLFLSHGFGAGPVLTDADSGTEARTCFFAMVLCFSRHQYVEFVFDQSAETWQR
jgi:hypothetical protein